MHSQIRGAGGQSRLSRITIFALTGMSITASCHRDADMTTRGLKIIPLVLALMVIGAQQAHATNEGSAYSAGYAHGVSDAKASMNDTLYITQPGKDFGFHTKQFNQGYIDGYCSEQEWTQTSMRRLNVITMHPGPESVEMSPGRL